jgi:hypothetical protein
MYFEDKPKKQFASKNLFIGLLIFLASAMAFADCKSVEDGKSSPFDGKLHAGVFIEKKSLVLLDKLYPKLNIVEKMFKGEILTCTACTDKYITCDEDHAS